MDHKKGTNPQQIPPHVSDRVWEHALHEEKVYNDRHNFFLLAQAMLFVFYATLGWEVQVWALVAVASLGLLLTILWLMIAKRQSLDLKIAVQRLERYCEEYPEFKKERVQMKGYRKGGMHILGSLVPILIGLTWAILIVEILTRNVLISI